MSDEPSTNTPPYLSYVTFKNTVQGLALSGQIPRQIDHSVLGTMGGSGRKMFLAALRFLDLIDDEGSPAERLRKLATASDSNWADFMQVLLREKYGDLVEQLSDASPKSLRDAFIQQFTGIGASLIEPAIRFLVTAARDCGLAVSSHLAMRKPRTGGNAPRKPRKSPKQAVIAEEVPPQTGGRSIKDALVAKFPSFDPTWDKESQGAWFAAFQRLIKVVDQDDSSGAE
jgi:hypothetical protein